MARRRKLDQQGIIEAFEQVIAEVDAAWVGGLGGTAPTELNAALARLHGINAADDDLAQVARHAAWSACWSLLHRIEAEGAASDAFEGIHEALPQDGEVPSLAPPYSRAPSLWLKQSHSAAFAPDGMRLATADGRLHALAGGTPFRHKVPAGTSTVAWSPTGEVVVFGGATRVVAYTPGSEVPLWSLKARDCILQFSVGGDLLLRRTTDGVEGLDPRTGAVLRKVDGDGRLFFGLHCAGDGTWRLGASHHPEYFIALAPPDLSAVRWLASPASLIALRADGVGLGLTLGHRELVVFYTTSGRELARWPTPGSAIHAAWSRDGGLLVIAHMGKLMEVSPVTGRFGPIAPAAFAFYDGETFVHLGDLERPYANHVAFSSDGALVALSTWTTGEVWTVRDVVAAATADRV